MKEFRGRLLPEPARLAGYAALIDKYDLRVPLPTRLVAITERSRPRTTDAWDLLPSKYAPSATLAGELELALKYEGVDLGVLAKLFERTRPSDIARIVRETPTGAYARRIWYLYEWTTNRRLPLPDATKVKAVPILDSDQQFALTAPTFSPRHRVLDNLPGARAFCPLVRRTANLAAFGEKHLDRAAQEFIGKIHPDVLARAAAFLLLSDSKASFAIEKEAPPAQRAARWAQIIGEAGSRSLSIAELERLQRIVIGDARFVQLGLRTEGGFVGVHDQRTREPLPDHISARPADLLDLVEGIAAYIDRAVRGGLDPVVVTATAAFGFVYIHPFEDGNGRLHRWLIHHILAVAGYNPPGLVFPISAAILRNIARYRAVLESYSRPLLPFIEWRTTAKMNIEVLNDTADYYRYFDATAPAEFLYDCVEQTIREDLPNEVAFLQAYDRFVAGVNRIVDMPDRMVDLLHGFLRQGEGRLLSRARRREFAKLTDDEVREIEALYRDSFAPSRSA